MMTALLWLLAVLTICLRAASAGLRVFVPVLLRATDSDLAEPH